MRLLSIRLRKRKSACDPVEVTSPTSPADWKDEEAALASVPVYSCKWPMEDKCRTPSPSNWQWQRMSRCLTEEDHHACLMATARDLRDDKLEEAGVVAKSVSCCGCSVVISNTASLHNWTCSGRLPKRRGGRGE